MSTQSAYEQEITEALRLWWLPLCVGVLSVAAGVIVLLKPEDSLTTIAVIVGIFILIDGVVAIVASLRRGTQSRGMTALVGVVSFVVGVLLIRHPISGVVAVALLVGLWLIAMGTLRFVLAFEESAHRGWHFVVAAIELIAGIVIVASPGIGLTTLALLIGIGLIANGVTLTALGIVLHGAGAETQAPRHHAAAV